MAVAIVRPLIYEDLLNTPDDRQRYEIVDGMLVVTPVAVPRHQEVCSRLGAGFSRLLRRRAGVGSPPHRPVFGSSRTTSSFPT